MVKIMRTSINTRKDIDAGRKARAAYMRDWRAANRDKVQQYNRDYWQRRAARDAVKADENGQMRTNATGD